ncbi:Peptidyl-prolyl isomerase cwc27, partial [Quaeritorhiza haematococci]
MSSVYVSEPPTRGKVILHTSAGDLEVELWAKETPKACRNFIQLCMEGYYDDTIFHRVVKGFIVQGGDPTGTGTGGESIYGQPFADEFHSRLRFSHRGLLAMATTGPNENQSQFFFTLDQTDELNRRNTIFGKIVGDTIYNLLKIGEVDTDEDERPIYPVKVLSTEVLSNPFEDIEPRTTPEERRRKAEEEVERAREKERVEKKGKGKKNLKLLSFGDEEEEESAALPAKRPKIKSSHDLLSDDPRLSKELVVEPETFKKDKDAREKTLKAGRREDDDDEMDFDARMREKVARQHKKRGTTEKTGAMREDVRDGRSVLQKEADEKIDRIRDEIAQVQKEIKTLGKRDSDSDSPSSKSSKKSKSFVDDFRKQYLGGGKALAGKRRKGRDDDDLMAKLDSFRSKLRKAEGGERGDEKKKEREDKEEAEAEAEDWVCELHGKKGCKSCRDTFGKDELGDDSGWMAHKLVFEKDAANVYEPKLDDYVVYDPRAEAQQGKSAPTLAPAGSRR